MNSVTRLVDFRPVRFLISGGLVALVSLGLTTALSIAGVPFQIALPIGFATGVTLHFFLHRHFTFAPEEPYALRASHQAGHFVAVAIAQYLFIAGGVALVTSLVDVPTLLAYFCLVALLSVGNFVYIGARVFHTRSVA